MKHWNYEHIQTEKNGLFHGYQQWIDHQDKLWYRGNYAMDEETGYHDQFLELPEGRHVPAIVIYYLR